MKHSEKLKAFEAQVAYATDILQKASLPETLIKEFNAIAVDVGPDIASDHEACLEDGRLVAFGEYTLDDMTVAFGGLATKYAKELFAAGFAEVGDRAAWYELYNPRPVGTF